VRLFFEEHGWEDYTSRLENDRRTLAGINKLVINDEIVIFAARYHY
jgi:Txe/YoeB family toxin of Txe-Axe toxin-antitoxin module